MTTSTPLQAPLQTALLSAENVSVHYRGSETLQSVSLSINQGEIVTLIGPNGAGKSTLIKCLLGIVKPSSGIVTKRPGLRIGYMPQKIHIDPSFPLNVERFLRLAGTSKKANIRARLEQVGALSLINLPVHSLSGGQFQRVLLARALLRDPELLVLDEPTQGVDISGQQELFSLLGEIREAQQCSILMVSHDLHLVMSSTDRVICLNQHVCCSGHPESVSNDPAYLQLFGIEDGKGFAIYEHHHDHHHDVSGQVSCEESHAEHTHDHASNSSMKGTDK